MSQRLTVAQAARALGMSERTVRRRVVAGKIPAFKDSSPETGAAWFIEQATIDALLQVETPPPSIEEGEEHKEDAAPPPVAALAIAPERFAQAPELALAQPDTSAEIVQLQSDVQQIKAFLVGQAIAESGEQLPTNLGTVIGQAMRETLAPMIERIEQQSAENALLKQQVAQALDRATQAEAREREREEEQAARRRPKSWWPFSKQRE